MSIKSSSERTTLFSIIIIIGQKESMDPSTHSKSHQLQVHHKKKIIRNRLKISYILQNYKEDMYRPNIDYYTYHQPSKHKHKGTCEL